MLKMIGLVSAVSEVILRAPEAVFFETEGFVDREATCGPPQELYSWFGHTGVTFDAKNDRPGPGSLRGHFYDARGYIFETEGFVGSDRRPSAGAQYIDAKRLVIYYI